MIVSGSQIQKALKLYGEQSKVSKNANADKANASQKKDEVILSSEAQGFRQILEKMNTIPDVRQERVSDLSAQISSGEYKVTSSEIAEKMLGRLAVDHLK